jgi:hypothetical protein
MASASAKSIVYDLLLDGAILPVVWSYLILTYYFLCLYIEA